MSIWGVIVILVSLFLGVALIAGWRGKEGGLARRQLRQLRETEGHGENASEVRKYRDRADTGPPVGGSPEL
jgi:hypothetical protein